ncbi:MAG TPA: hypothetical protein VJV23_14455 [Candidatus Polarisedimenticolia bacterium]|nr:hypothetical protein [Candidatus Polarisedimenticolia bacterium]
MPHRARTPALTLVFVTLLWALAARGAAAASSDAWVLRQREELLQMKMDGVAITGEGAFRLSASVAPLMDSTQPNLWCLARDARGRLYAGGGNEGKVYRLPEAAGEPELVFDSDQLEVHALAFDSKGRLYAATSPRGAVYLVGEAGMGTIVFDPDDAYIWAIAFDEKDRLHVATGQRGRVYRIDRPGPNAASRVVLDSREDHIRSLTPAAGGAFYAGSDQNGILYRIEADGTSSVVYDSPMRELAALTVVQDAAQGELIYAAALAPMPRQRGGGGAAVSGGVTRVRVTADDSPGSDQEQQGEGEEQAEAQGRREAPRPAPQEAYYGALYEVTPKGYARKLWESREALPLSLAPFVPPRQDGGAAPLRGHVLVGTGNDGRVVLVDGAGEATDYVRVSSQQVTALLAGGDGGVIAAGSNLGQVVSISPGVPLEGTVTSTVHDAGFTSTWGAISWKADLPRGTSIALRARTGNTEQPDGTWSDWSQDYTEASGTTIDRPRARYVQWKAILRSGGSGQSPSLKDIQVHYLQDNLPPEVASVDVMAAGVVLGGSGERPGDQGEGGAAARRAQNQPRRSFEKGRRSVSWKSEDGNDDALVYDVQFKAEDETLWKPLARGIQDEFHTWDATALPDGVYRIRITASDAPSNPPGSALTGSRTSAPFDVDNTPPSVGAPQARLQSRWAEVTVVVTDTFSPIAEVSYSLDAGEWVPLLPEDRIADSRRESYRFRTPEMEPGEHTVTVRARDRAGNAAAGKVVIEVPR